MCFCFVCFSFLLILTRKKGARREEQVACRSDSERGLNKTKKWWGGRGKCKQITNTRIRSTYPRCIFKCKHGRPAVQHSYSCTPQHRGTAGTFSCSRQKWEKKRLGWFSLKSPDMLVPWHGAGWDLLSAVPAKTRRLQAACGGFDLIWSCRFGVRGGDVGLERHVVCSLMRTNFIVWLSLIASYIQLAFHPPATQRTEITTQAFSCTSRAYRSDKAKMLQQLNSRLIIINN